MNKPDLPKGITKLPAGIEIHRNRVRLRFTYKGVRCREMLDAPVSKGTLAYAENKLRVIKTEIREGRFDYAAHFPRSSMLAQLTANKAIDPNRTVADGVNAWLKVHEVSAASSTFKGYRFKAAHVLNRWPRERIADIPISEIKLFQGELLKQGLAPKTVNDVFTVVRGVWGEAYDDGIIKTNIIDRVKNIEREDNDDSADPFTKDELDRIAGVHTRRQEDINMIMFASWCGLSVSELIALAWEDIDTVKWVVKVQRARVNTEYKVPKERVRVREVELVEQAVHWLKRQMQHTAMLSPRELKVRQRDNVTVKTESVRLVFNNGSSEGAWHPSSVNRWFTSHLKRAKVRHRGPNQCRHTFASQCLSHYVPMEWLARQLGHSDTTMIKKHYGRWIPKDTPSMAGLVSKMLATDTDKGRLELFDFGPKLAPGMAQK